MPDKWEFDYPFSKVKRGFKMWLMTDFRTMPSQDDVDRFDEDWVNDLYLALMFYQHQNNKSGVMRLFEQLSAVQNNGQEFIDQQQIDEYVEYYEQFPHLFEEIEQINNPKSRKTKKK